MGKDNQNERMMKDEKNNGWIQDYFTGMGHSLLIIVPRLICLLHQSSMDLRGLSLLTVPYFYNKRDIGIIPLSQKNTSFILEILLSYHPVSPVL